MPILKTEILGSSIEISYQENEYDVLCKLIQVFKDRLIEFPNSGKHSVNTILFLAALKAEDELSEQKIKIQKEKKYNESDKKIIIENDNINEKLNQEIISLKQQLQTLKKTLLSYEDNEKKIIKEIINFDDLIKKIQKKMMFIK
jgi:septal ring factor EnvC (AmiA/AmiB activator)